MRSVFAISSYLCKFSMYLRIFVLGRTYDSPVSSCHRLRYSHSCERKSEYESRF